MVFKAYSFELFALTMSHTLQLIFLFFLLVALFSGKSLPRHRIKLYLLINIYMCIFIRYIVAVYGLPAPWGPNSNGKPLGGPSWNGGGDESTDNIILGTGHKNGNRWNY